MNIRKLFTNYAKEFLKQNLKLSKEKLSSKSYLGLYLIVGITVSLLFIWIFGEITENVLNKEPFAIDRWFIKHISYFRTSLINEVMKVITVFGGYITIVPASLIVVIILLVQKRFDYLFTYIVSIIGGTLFFLVLKMTIQRNRPITEKTLIEVEGWSFPSGHATMSVIFYGIIAYFIIKNIHSFKLSVLLTILTGFIVILIGFSRIYLQVHYVTDVLVGYAGGIFWLSICITGFEFYRRKKVSS